MPKSSILSGKMWFQLMCLISYPKLFTTILYSCPLKLNKCFPTDCGIFSFTTLTHLPKLCRRSVLSCPTNVELGCVICFGLVMIGGWPLDFELGHLTKQTWQVHRLGMCFVIGLVLLRFCCYHENISQGSWWSKEDKRPVEHTWIQPTAWCQTHLGLN